MGKKINERWAGAETCRECDWGIDDRVGEEEKWGEERDRWIGETGEWEKCHSVNSQSHA